MCIRDRAKTLFDTYKIFTVAINGSGVRGCRISPNVFTSIKELDVLLGALKAMGWFAADCICGVTWRVWKVTR